MSKTCARCGTVKPVDQFHKQPTGPLGRHSWCKSCANAYYRSAKQKNYSSEQKRRWLLKSRYGMTLQDVDALARAQGGQCGLCATALGAKFCVDHDHATGKVRGLLCHRCNVIIGGLDDRAFHAKVNAWLERGR